MRFFSVFLLYELRFSGRGILILHIPCSPQPQFDASLATRYTGRMFFDEAKIHVKSGDGGSGMSHFRREKYVPRGGPDGGDGGKGGDITLVASIHVNTLAAFSRQHQFSSEDGKKGGTNNKTGATAADIRIDVPIGTIVRDAKDGILMADLTKEGQEIVVARGGRGGRGNARFVTSINQATKMAEKGEPGEERDISLELKLIADVGIVGVPNAGKSTLLSVISNATPKIAAYPFTTLEPNLGVVWMDDSDFVAADIPGLVEGAHLGIGLGHSFLRHIQRTRVLIHLLDGGGQSPLADFNQINAELALFDEHLLDKPMLVVLNKMDLPDAQEHWPRVKRELEARGYTALSMSAATQQNTRSLVQQIFQILSELPPVNHSIEGTPQYTLGEDKDAFAVSREDDGGFRISGERIERAAKMTYWDIEESAHRFQKILEALGITKALEAEGIVEGDMVYIGDTALEWGE